MLATLAGSAHCLSPDKTRGNVANDGITRIEPVGSFAGCATRQIVLVINRAFKLSPSLLFGKIAHVRF